MNADLARLSVVMLVNKSGGLVMRGDVVIVDDANTGSFTTTIVQGLTRVAVGVVISPDGIPNNSIGTVAFGGYVLIVNLDSVAAIGDKIRTSSTAKKATPHATFGPSDFGVVLSSSTTPDAILFSGAPLKNIESYARFEERVGAGTPGGTSKVAGYSVRKFPTCLEDNDSIFRMIALSAFYPIAGTYRIRASAPAALCGRHKAVLYNVTTATTILVGTSEYCSNESSSRSEISGVFTANGTDVYEILSYTELEIVTFGLGVPVSSDDLEIYTIVELWKLG